MALRAFGRGYYYNASSKLAIDLDGAPYHSKVGIARAVVVHGKLEIPGRRFLFLDRRGLRQIDVCAGGRGSGIFGREGLLCEVCGVPVSEWLSGAHVLSLVVVGRLLHRGFQLETL